MGGEICVGNINEAYGKPYLSDTLSLCYTHRFCVVKITDFLNLADSEYLC